MKQKKYNKYANTIERKTKKSIAKQKIIPTNETTQDPMSKDLDFHSIKRGGFCLLNLNKKRRNGEIYTNSEFNKTLRRKFNFTQQQMDGLSEGYNTVKSGFTTRKAMLKYFRKKRKEELPLRKELQRLQKEKQNESTPRMVAEKVGTSTIIENTTQTN